jgi:hypothetical protein
MFSEYYDTGRLIGQQLIDSNQKVYYAVPKRAFSGKYGLIYWTLFTTMVVVVMNHPDVKTIVIYGWDLQSGMTGIERFLHNFLISIELISLLNRCSIFIGNSTGPMHLAAGVKVPVITLFGNANFLENYKKWETGVKSTLRSICH